MLVQNRASRQEKVSRIKKTTSFSSHDLPQVKGTKTTYGSKTRYKVKEKQSSLGLNKNASLKIESPLWLKVLNFLGTTSTGMSIIVVGFALVAYGFTVSAPKLWTQKYEDLQNLQQKERQFTFTDEMLKNQLAEEAKNQDSGLINPDPLQQPIYLEKKEVKPIRPSEATSPPPKTVQPIFPVAY